MNINPRFRPQTLQPLETVRLLCEIKNVVYDNQLLQRARCDGKQEELIKNYIYTMLKYTILEFSVCF